MWLRLVSILWFFALVPAHAQDYPLYGVPWGDGRSCAGTAFYPHGEPPRYRVPKPWYVGEGFIVTGSEFCSLTRIEGEPQDSDGVSGFYVADCVFAYGGGERHYTIAMLEQDDSLTMVWKSLASPETYPAKIGPLHQCGLGNKVPVPWEDAEYKWPTTD